MIYRFIGTESFVADKKLERFGQAIELTPEAARATDAPIIPEEAFAAHGFTPEELDAYAYPGPRQDAPEEFKQKCLKARIALHDFRTKGGE